VGWLVQNAGLDGELFGGDWEARSVRCRASGATTPTVYQAVCQRIRDMFLDPMAQKQWEEMAQIAG